MGNKLVGYARVSSKMQSLDLQIRQLKDFAEKESAEIEIFSETLSVKANKNDERYPLSTQRPKLADALNRAKELDCMLVVTYLDRLARSQVIWDKICKENVRILALYQDVNNADEIIRQAESENKLRSMRSKNVIAMHKKEMKERRIEIYKDVFYKEGSPEYVLCYVENELISYPAHKSPNWSEGDLLSCIESAWGDCCIGINCTIEQASIVAECALDYIKNRESRKNCALECPQKGWRFDDKSGCQVKDDTQTES